MQLSALLHLRGTCSCSCQCTLMFVAELEKMCRRSANWREDDGSLDTSPNCGEDGGR